MNALFRSTSSPLVRLRRFVILSAIGFVGIAAHAQAPCPGYVETDSGSAFDLASMIRDAGSPQSALGRLRDAVAKVDAGGGCSRFRDPHACEETLTLAHKAIVALETCSPPGGAKGSAHG